MDPCYQPRKKPFAEIDPDEGGWFWGALVFYCALAAALLIGATLFLVAFLVERPV